MSFADEHGVSQWDLYFLITSDFSQPRLWQRKQTTWRRLRKLMGDVTVATVSMLKTQVLDLKLWSNLSTLIFTFPCLSTPPLHRLIPNKWNVLNYNISCVFYPPSYFLWALSPFISQLVFLLLEQFRLNPPTTVFPFLAFLLSPFSPLVLSPSPRATSSFWLLCLSSLFC